jgi:cyclohexadienyl dehydratase
MTKHGWRFAASAMALALLAACSSPPPAPVVRVDLDQIVATGTVRVCSAGDYRPFTYHDPQGWSGLDIEMAQDLAKHARYSSPYLRDGKAAAVRCADRSKYQTLADIDRPGVRIVVNPGGTNAEYDAANIHQATVVKYPDNNTIFGQVSSNTADVMITDASEIRWQSMQNPQLCGVGLDHPFTFEQKAYLIPQSNTALQQWVNQWLNITQNDGTYTPIAKKWLGDVGQP